MKNTIVIGVLCVAALAVGAWLYFSETVPVTKSVEAPAAAVAAASEIRPAVLDRGVDARGYNERKNYAIYDAAKFEETWKKVHGSVAGMPRIDFSKSYVLAVFAGEKPTGGYAIDVERVTDSDAARMVGISITEPGRGCVATQAKTAPYEFVSVPLSGPLELRHRDVAVTKDCN